MVRKSNHQPPLTVNVAETTPACQGRNGHITLAVPLADHFIFCKCIGITAIKLVMTRGQYQQAVTEYAKHPESKANQECLRILRDAPKSSPAIDQKGGPAE